MDTLFIKTPEQQERVERALRLAASFREEAHEADRNNRFSFRHIEELKRQQFMSLTVPKEYGGAGISLYELVQVLECLAQGDSSIALGLGWHLGVLYDLAQKQCWERTVREATFLRVVGAQSLINRAITEPATGSLSRGGMPTTRLEATDAPDGRKGYLIKGRKTFTTLSPVLDTAIVTAVLDDTVVDVLVSLDTAGVRVEPTWDMMGMRGTASHDLILDYVRVDESALVHRHSQQDKGQANPYLLHIPAVYLGIALAARREALAFAASYQPNSADQPILYAPNVAQLLAELDLELTAARHFLYSVAARWDDAPPADAGALIPELAAAKTVAVRAAMHAVDKALRITGAHGLRSSHPLQRMYRDVRYGLHNPPMDDQTHRLLYQRAVRQAQSEQAL